MTTREAAAMLGVSPHAVRMACLRGTLRAEKRGRDWWVTPVAVEEYKRTIAGKPGRKSGK